MLPYPLTNFKIQKYCQNEVSFHVFFSGSNLPKIKGWVYVIDLYDFQSCE